MKMKINPDEIYSLRQIEELKLVPTEADPASSRQRLRRHVRDGWLKAKNMGTELRPRYVVFGEDLLEYLEKYHNVPVHELRA